MSAAVAKPRAGGPRVVVDLAVGCFAIGWAAIFLRLAATDALLASALRLAIAAVLLAPAIARAWLARRLPRRVLRASLLGGALYAAHFAAWIASLERTSVAASVTLVTATPVVLALVGTLRRRDRPGRREGAAIALTTIGVVAIGASDAAGDRSSLAGDALALVGALAMAGYLLLVRELGEPLDPFAFSGLCAAAGALVLAPAIGLAALGAEAPAGPGWASLGWIALSAAIPQVIGHSLLTRALRGATPTAVGLATCSEPVLSALLAIPILGERPGALVALGCAITLAGVALGAPRR